MVDMVDKDLEKHFGVALAALSEGDWAQAQNLFAEITRGWPDCKEAWYQRGELYQRQGVLTEAVEMYARVLALDPGIEEVYRHLGLIAAQQQENELAIGYWSQALSLNQNYSEVRLQLAMLLARNAQVPEAIEQLRMLLTLTPEMAAALLLQARAALQQGQFYEASALCQALRQQGGSAEFSQSVIFLELQVLHELGLDPQAEFLLQEFSGTWSDALRTLYVPAHFADAGALAAAREKLDRALAAPAPRPLPIQAELPRLRGWQLLERGEAVDAWLRQAAGLNSPACVLPRSDMQRLVWIVDASCLPWQMACWRHLSALPSRRWELVLLLRQENLALVLEPPQRGNLLGFHPLPADYAEARELIRKLRPHALLFADPQRDPLQFWLAQEALAPVQLAWPGAWPQSSLSGSQSDTQASLWPTLEPGSASGEAIVYPVPAAGWSPEDLVQLKQLGAERPLRLLATPAELGAVRQLLQALASLDCQPIIWRQLRELGEMLAQSRALLLPSQNAGVYQAAAGSCGLPCFHSAAEILAYLSTDPDPAAGPDADWLERRLQNPYAEWAVTLQDRLARTWKSIGGQI